MDHCCEIRTDLPAHQGRVLRIVFWLNAVMFLAEFGAGLAANSTALLADSVDMLGDAVVYGFSLYAIARGTVWHARVALLKGLVMAAFAVGVLMEVTHKLVAGVVPTADVMSIVGLLRSPPMHSASSSCPGTAVTISTCNRRGCARGMTSLRTEAFSSRLAA